MPLYPSLEDAEVDQQAIASGLYGAPAPAYPQAAPAPAAIQSFSSGSSLYSNLGLESLDDYRGLNIGSQAIQSYVPRDIAAQILSPPRPVAITPVGDANLARAAIQQGVRPVVLAKDQQGKLGVCVTAIDKGLFVSFVWNGSAASLAGIRFGDQILQINGETVAGWSSDKATTFLKKADPARVSLMLRDRPYERCITVVKDHLNHIGFLFKHGQITALVKDSSAAKNGVLIHHHLCEVNGQNVVGMTDETLQKLIQEAPRSVTLTLMPSFVYEHLIKHIGFSKLKKFMDHSIPEY